MLTEIKNFLVHLRLHYQIFILSGAYLFGGVFSQNRNLIQFIIGFFIVHILLFGGVTAYNSYWDKDEGPIGGLLHPPAMKRWMLAGSWILQVLGFVALMLSNSHIELAMLYLASALFFWLYSSPSTRWKGKPLRSLAAIGISTVFCSFYLGFLISGGALNTASIIAALGAVCVSF